MSAEPPRLYVVTRRRPDRIAGRPAQPGASRAAWPDAGDRRRASTAAHHPDRPGRRRRRRAGGPALLAGSDEDETAWRGGHWYTARCCATPLRPEERASPPSSTTDRMRCEVRNPGDLRTLEFVAFDRIPPGPGEIEVAVDASSLNFADVLVALRPLPRASRAGRTQLGIDFAGVVTAVGPDVTDHQVGDRVGGFSGYATAAGAPSSPATPAGVTLPPGLGADQAAAVATASRAPRGTACTTWPGSTAEDKVLIHSGTGGVGQAAIAIARAVGAEIFATAGSPERRATVARHGNRARLRLAQHRIRRADPPRHRRVRRRHRAQLADRRRPARRTESAGLRWTVRRDRQDATSTATPGWDCSRSAATSRSTPSTWRCCPTRTRERLRDLLQHGVPARRRR